MVPPLASSNIPLRSFTAPVKAPRAWPNSSLSSSPSARAEQFTATNGFDRRGLSSWMARAISSFPVPVAPRRRTVLSVGATRAMARSTSLIRGVFPTSRAAPAPSTGSRRASTALILLRSTALSHGLVM
jgi:hypothetical protein